MVEFSPTTKAEQAAFAEIIPALVTRPPVAFARTPQAAALAGRAGTVGYVLELWQVEGAWFWVLREREDARRGAGTYVFRAGTDAAEPASDEPLVVLQAPHVYFDRRTGTIAAALLFEHNRADMLLTNSLHRFQQGPNRRQREARNPADVCHNEHHLFQQVTALVADADVARQTIFVQIHGFGSRDVADSLAEEHGLGTPDAAVTEEPAEEHAHDSLDTAPATDEKRSAGSGEAASTSTKRPDIPDIIVSAGTRAGSTPHSTTVAQALARTFGSETVWRYPEEIQMLGGTTNVQGRMLRKRANTSFLHLELSAAMRRRLTQEPEQRAAFGEAVLSSYP